VLAPVWHNAATRGAWGGGRAGEGAGGKVEDEVQRHLGLGRSRKGGAVK
jgi:hypothetical protein